MSKAKLSPMILRKDSEHVQSFESWSTAESKPSVTEYDLKYCKDFKDFTTNPLSEIQESLFESLIGKTYSSSNSNNSNNDSFDTDDFVTIKLRSSIKFVPASATKSHKSSFDTKSIGVSFPQPQSATLKSQSLVYEDYFQSPSHARNHSQTSSKGPAPNDIIPEEVDPTEEVGPRPRAKAINNQKYFIEIARSSSLSAETEKKLDFSKPKRKISHNVEDFSPRVYKNRLTKKSLEEIPMLNYLRSKSAGELAGGRENANLLKGYNLFNVTLIVNGKKVIRRPNRDAESTDESSVGGNSPLVKWKHQNEVIFKSNFSLEESRAHKYIFKIINETKRSVLLDTVNLDARRTGDELIIYKQHASNDNMKLSNLTAIKFITLDKLLNEFVHTSFFLSNPKIHSQQDYDYNLYYRAKHVFIMTYDTVMTSLDLLNELLRRFFIPVPKQMSGKEKEAFTTNCIEPSQINALEFIKYWFLERPNDFVENKEMVVLLKVFLNLVMFMYSEKIKSSALTVCSYLERLQLVLRHKKKHSHLRRCKLIKCISTSDPSQIPSLITRNDQKAITYYTTLIQSLENYDFYSNPKAIFYSCTGEELAKQLCILDFELFSKLLHKNLPHIDKSKKKIAERKGPYANIINHTNLLTYYIIYAILKDPTPEGRTLFVNKIYEIVEHLVKFNNYQSFFIIMSALHHYLILRCKDALSGLSLVTLQRKQKYDMIYSASSGHNNLRKEMKHAMYPMVPAMMMISKSLSKLEVEDTYTDLNDRKYLNFKKMEETCDSLEKLFSSQKIPYKFEKICILQKFFSKTYRAILEDAAGSQKAEDVEEFLVRLVGLRETAK